MPALPHPTLHKRHQDTACCTASTPLVLQRSIMDTQLSKPLLASALAFTRAAHCSAGTALLNVYHDGCFHHCHGVAAAHLPTCPPGQCCWPAFPSSPSFCNRTQVGAIVPWNWPFHNVLNPLTAAVFAGNSIIIKVRLGAGCMLNSNQWK